MSFKNLPNQEPDSATAPGSSVKGGDKFKRIKAFLIARYDLRWNVISNDIEFRYKDTDEYQTLNEHEIRFELMENGESNFDRILTALLYSRRIVKEFNPITEYFKELPRWDESQPDYILDLASYVKTKDQAWFQEQFKKMLVRTVACALNVVPFNKQCFTLLSNQNDGKSSFFRFLCPPKLAAYYTENIDFINKDGRLALCQNFLINLDELATFSRADIKQIKAFISRENVKDRLPYDKRPKVFPRLASFVGSTNSDEFLTDETGNVRWLVHEVVSIQHDNGGPQGYNANVDIDLVYSQAYALLKSGFNFKMTRKEVEKSEVNNKKYIVETQEQDCIQRTFYPATKAEHEVFATAGMIAEMFKVYKSLNTNSRRINRAFKTLGYKQITGYVKGVTTARKGYYLSFADSSDKTFFI